MIGRFIASPWGGPCTRCGRPIRGGSDVYYDGPRLDDQYRVGSCCVEFDLFGRAA